MSVSQGGRLNSYRMRWDVGLRLHLLDLLPDFAIWPVVVVHSCGVTKSLRLFLAIKLLCEG